MFYARTFSLEINYVESCVYQDWFRVLEILQVNLISLCA
jgi:hypothetical protein